MEAPPGADTKRSDDMIITESYELTYKIENVMSKLTNDINHLDSIIQTIYSLHRDELAMGSEGLTLLNEFRDKKDAYQELKLMNYFYKKGTLTDSDLKIFSDCLGSLIGFRFDDIEKSKITRKTLSSPHLMGLSYGVEHEFIR